MVISKIGSQNPPWAHQKHRNTKKWPQEGQNWHQCTSCGPTNWFWAKKTKFESVRSKVCSFHTESAFLGYQNLDAFKNEKYYLRSSSSPCAGNDMGLRENSMQSQDLLGMTDYLPVVFRTLVFHCIGHDMGLREISMQIDLEASDR